MIFFLQQYQEVILTLLKNLFKKNHFIFIGIFYPTSGHELLGGVGWLLCCDALAVDNHSCMGRASHLQQPRPVAKEENIFSPFFQKLNP